MSSFSCAFAASDFATVLISGRWPTCDEGSSDRSACCSPFSRVSTMFNTFEVVCSSG